MECVSVSMGIGVVWLPCVCAVVGGRGVQWCSGGVGVCSGVGVECVQW